jgi:hypothetical protein
VASFADGDAVGVGLAAADALADGEGALAVEEGALAVEEGALGVGEGALAVGEAATVVAAGEVVTTCCVGEGDPADTVS